MAVLATPTSNTLSNTEITFRLSTIIPSATKQWRVRIRNYKVGSEAAVMFGANFTGIYHGRQALAAGLASAGFVSAPQSAVGAFTLAADGTEYVSPWITAMDNQIGAGVPWLFSFAYTGGSASGQASGQGQMWYIIGAGSAANLANQAATSFLTTGAAPFDIRIEYDTLTANKIGLAIGDSITYGTGSAVLSQQFSYPMIYGRRSGNPVANGGIPSATLLQWQGGTAQWKWQRFDPANIAYDFAIVMLGTNDVSASATLANMQTYFLQVVAQLNALGINTVRGGTLTPRNLAHGILQLPVLAGATSLVIAGTVLTVGNFQIGEGPTPDVVTTSGTPTDNANGTFTYVCTATAGAHRAGETVSLSQQTVMLGFNAWLRGLPAGIADALHFDRAVAATYDKSIMQPEFAESDGLHPS